MVPLPECRAGFDAKHGQNIDENFSKIHNLLANRLLPAVKRYAIGTEPVREAAQVGLMLALLILILNRFEVLDIVLRGGGSSSHTNLR